MSRTWKFIWTWKIWSDISGQDMMEYACFMAAIMLLYAAVSPTVASGVLNVLTRVSSNLSTAAGQ